MTNYIETRIKYDKTHPNGVTKKTTEKFLVDAMSFTEAEARIVREITPYISGEFDVSAVKKSRIAEIVRDDAGDKWYRCKIAFITVDERTATEKRKMSLMLVQAGDISSALANTKKAMSGTISDYEITEISETAILDVYDAATTTTDGQE
jgi:hypothetical protein